MSDDAHLWQSSRRAALSVLNHICPIPRSTLSLRDWGRQMYSRAGAPLVVTTEINKDGSSQNGRAESAAASGVLNQPFCMPPLTIRVLVGEGCRKRTWIWKKKITSHKLALTGQIKCRTIFKIRLRSFLISINTIAP